MYGAVRIQLTYFSYDDCENMRSMYLITTIKSEVWPTRHCLVLVHETIICPACLFIFL